MRISGFENILHLDEFSVEKSCGAHSVCAFRASIKAEDEDAFLGRAGQDIQVLWDGEEKSKCVFSGRIEEVRLVKQLHSSLVEVRALSLSAAESVKEHTRIWQNPKKKLGDVLAAAKLELESCNLRLLKSLAAQNYALPILQNQESNFAFLLRIAGYMDIPLWVEDTKDGQAAVVLSDCLTETVCDIDAEDILRYEAVREQSGRKLLTLTLQKYMPFGSRVKIAGEAGEYVICGLRIELYREIYEFRCRLKPYSPWKYEAAPAPRLEKTVFFKGTVEDNRDGEHLGRVLVSFQDGAVRDMDKERMWIPYHTPYTGLAGGMVFLPDKGDEVNVVFSNEGIYAAAALRENAMAEECRKVDNKYLGNNTLQRIFFLNKALKIASGDFTIFMDEEKIELTAGASRITMTQEAITLKQGETRLMLDNKGTYIKAGCNEMAWNEQGIIGNSKKSIGLETQGKVDIAGKGSVKMTADGSLSIKGSAVNIDGTSVNIG